MKQVWTFGLLALVLSTAAEAQDTPAQPPASTESLMIDNMDDLSKNSLGGRNSTYLQAPSRAAFTKAEDYGKSGGGLKLTYDLKNEGGPRGDGGFCGYYTLVKKGTDGYLDASPYQYITFWVKGEKGEEKFKIGVADKMYETMDDSVKSQEIGSYLPAGKITTDWQMAAVPLADFFVDWKLVASFSICFEHDTFDNGAGAGIIYIDEFELVKNKPGPEVAPTVPDKKPEAK
jgi:carbohydrate binding protein with CBM30 domain